MAKPRAVLNFVENNLLPNISVEWKDQDITGYTILLHVRKPNGLKFTKTAVIDDANTGNVSGIAMFHFEWSAGDLVAGKSDAEIEVFDVSSKNETFKGLILDVDEALA